jgi:hypothetical protein
VKIYGTDGSRDPMTLIESVKKKYPYFVVPSSVSLLELSRLLSVYTVPDSYRAMLPSFSNDGFKYSPDFDVLSPQFSAIRAIEERTLIGRYLYTSPYDNLSKAKVVLPGMNMITTSAKPKEREQKSSDVVVREEKRPFILDEIADRSSKESVNYDQIEKVIMTPLEVLLKFMRSSEKATVVIRGRDRYLNNV